MKSFYSKHSIIWYILFLSGLGCISYFLVVFYIDFPGKKLDTINSIKAFIAILGLFNCLGLSIGFIHNRIQRNFSYFLKDKKRLIYFLILTSILLFILNYSLLTYTKWMINAENPFYLKWSGVRMLIFTWLIEIVIVSQSLATNFYRHMIDLYKKVSQLEESSVKAQYLALQNQLNPHFLFNSLNTLIAEIEYNPKNASLFTRYLSDVYRYILQCQDLERISIASELEFMDAYLFLHKVRLGDCIVVDIILDEYVKELYLPPLTLQLLVENIIKHNMISASKVMNIQLYTEQGNKMLVIKNKIMTKKESAISGIGLNNLSKRYLLLCGENIIIERDNHYFIVKVPILYE